MSNLPAPSNGGPIHRFWHAGHADPLDGWRCCSQKRVMSRPIQVPKTTAYKRWNCQVPKTTAYKRWNCQVPKTTAYKRWNCQVTRPANCCHLIPSNRFLDGFPVPSQFAAAKLTHYSTMPHRPSDSSRPRQRLLLSGDVHQNPGPATKYPCSVCSSNVTSRGVSYMCNRCSGWVHSKCSGLQNAAEYRRIKNWACISCSSPPTPQIPKPLPSPITPKLPMGIPSPFCNSTQMASATNRLN